jgi:acetyl esterase/lipase
MTMTHRLDPELAAPLEGFLTLMGGGLNLHDIPATRAMASQMLAAMKDQLPVIEGVTTEDRTVPGPDGAPDVPVRIYQPTNRPDTLPALLWIHGGGYVLGNIEGDDLLAKHLVTAVECVVVSVEYRLAPEHPFPAPVEDCYAALKWLATHIDELGVKQSRIAIGGASAGGGLAAGLALLARDRAEVEVAFQLLIYPMIDDRNLTQASETVPDTFVWSREDNLIGWRSYLGREPGGDDVSPYAAALRATDLSGLPPAYIPVGELDLFLNENMAYAQRLLDAGVPTELHVYPGAFHGFEGLAPAAGVSQRMAAERDHVLKHVLYR